MSPESINRCKFGNDRILKSIVPCVTYDRRSNNFKAQLHDRNYNESRINSECKSNRWSTRSRWNNAANPTHAVVYDQPYRRDRLGFDVCTTALLLPTQKTIFQEKPSGRNSTRLLWLSFLRANGDRYSVYRLQWEEDNTRFKRWAIYKSEGIFANERVVRLGLAVD